MLKKYRQLEIGEKVKSGDYCCWKKEGITDEAIERENVRVPHKIPEIYYNELNKNSDSSIRYYRPIRL